MSADTRLWFNHYSTVAAVYLGSGHRTGAYIR